MTALRSFTTLCLSLSLWEITNANAFGGFPASHLQTRTSRPTTELNAAAAIPVLKTAGKAAVAIALRGGGPAKGVDDLEMAVDAFDWCSNLGAPAALVGGAVLATLAETREFLAPKKSDTRRLRLAKQATRFLLLSAFALEIISIFSTTVTGTMLLAHGDVPAGHQAGIAYHSPMGFLRFNHEFEYLTARITFLQGLFHWLIATALEVVIPKEKEGEAAKRMNQFIASSLFTIVLLMLSFYNAHMSFYENYFVMCMKYFHVVFARYVLQWRTRPLAFLYIPSIAVSIATGWRAFVSPPDLDKDD